MTNWEFEGYVERMLSLIEKKHKSNKPAKSAIAIRLDFAEALLKEYKWFKNMLISVHYLSRTNPGRDNVLNNEKSII